MCFLLVECQFPNHSQLITSALQCIAEVACTKEEEGLALPEQTTLCPRVRQLRREERPLARLRLVARAGPDWLHQYCLCWHHFPLLLFNVQMYNLLALTAALYLFTMYFDTTVATAAVSIQFRAAHTSRNSSICNHFHVSERTHVSLDCSKL